MKRYFKIVNDAILGQGFVYYEFTDEPCTRQMIQDGENWLYFERKKEDLRNWNTWSNYERKEDIPHWNMCDQPLSKSDFYVENEISEQEFESVWRKSEETSNPT